MRETTNNYTILVLKLHSSVIQQPRFNRLNDLLATKRWIMALNSA